MRVFAHQDAQPKKTFDKSRHVHCTLCNIIQECLLLKAGKAEREACQLLPFRSQTSQLPLESQTPSSISPPHPVISVYYFPSSIVLFTQQGELNAFFQQLSQLRFRRWFCGQYFFCWQLQSLKIMTIIKAEIRVTVLFLFWHLAR